MSGGGSGLEVVLWLLVWVVCGVLVGVAKVKFALGEVKCNCDGLEAWEVYCSDV